MYNDTEYHSPVVSEGKSCFVHSWAAKESRIIPQPSLCMEPSGAVSSGI